MKNLSTTLKQQTLLEGELLTEEEEAEIHRSRKATDEFNQGVQMRLKQQREFWEFVQKSDALRRHAQREKEEKIKREREASNDDLKQGALFGLATVLVIWLAGFGFNYLKEFFR